MSARALTDDEALRLGRNVLLPEIGVTGQETLRAATVRITELGAVGSAAALYLGAAGIGALACDDARPVTAADLAGTLYRAADVGRPRVEALRDAMAALDPALTVTPHPDPLPVPGRGGVLVGIDARDLADDRCTLARDGATVSAAGGPGPQGLLAGALAAAEAVKAILGLGGVVQTERLP